MKNLDTHTESSKPPRITIPFSARPPVVRWAIFAIAGIRLCQIPRDASRSVRNQKLRELKSWLVERVGMDERDLESVRQAVRKKFGGPHD